MTFLKTYRKSKLLPQIYKALRGLAPASLTNFTHALATVAS